MLSIALHAAVTMIGAAHAYGEVANGRPTWAQRELLVYTNLVRVDPGAWRDDYDCAYNQFEATEKQPKGTLRFHDGLTEIAQLHSEDMRATSNMAHESSDGTTFSNRVWPYYEGMTIGENVAYGYADNAEVMWEGWMCSAGHRSNIMEGEFEDLGTGVAGRYYTQDFGGGAHGVDLPVDMAIQVPEAPTSSVRFYATWDWSEAPATLQVETEEACEDMSMLVGTDSRGGWSLDSNPESGCVPWRISWTTGSAAGVLPESGAWQYGEGCPLWTAFAPTGCTPEPEPGDEGGDGGGADTGTTDGDTADPCPELGPEEDRNGDCIADDAPHGDKEGAGCGCASTRAGSTGLPTLLFGLLALGVQRRRQGQGRRRQGQGRTQVG
jgi:hypothetical protein